MIKQLFPLALLMAAACQPMTAEQLAEREERRVVAAAEREERQRVNAVELRCLQAVDRVLRDPQTAITRWDQPISTQPNEYVVTIRVRAQNAFGAYLTTHFLCTISTDPDNPRASRLDDLREF